MLKSHLSKVDEANLATEGTPPNMTAKDPVIYDSNMSPNKSQTMRDFKLVSDKSQRRVLRQLNLKETYQSYSFKNAKSLTERLWNPRSTSEKPVLAINEKSETSLHHTSGKLLPYLQPHTI